MSPSQSNAKHITLITFWGSFGGLILVIITAAFTFSTRVTRSEEQIFSLKEKLAKDQATIEKLDETQREILIKLNNIENSEKYQSELLIEIKNKLNR